MLTTRFRSEFVILCMVSLSRPRARRSGQHAVGYELLVAPEETSFAAPNAVLSEEVPVVSLVAPGQLFGLASLLFAVSRRAA